jgi:regulator of protease activity HflC (stomatin/prohibitin superfamily)
MIPVDWLIVLVVGAAIVFFLGSFIRIVPEYERVIIFRLGRKTKAVLNPGGEGNGPGLVLLVPFIDKIRQRISLRTVAMDVPPQDVITRDNVSIKVNAVIFFRVINPEQAFLSVEDYIYATSQLAQTTLRSVLG